MSRIFNRVLNQRLANHGLRIVRLEDAHGAQLGAIFARLDLLHTRIAALETDVERLQEARAADNGLMSALFTRLTALESARIAALEAPESAVTASGVPQEPGNATEALSEALRKAHDLAFNAECVVRRMRATDAEVAAALRMYRKVQGCTVDERGVVYGPDGSSWNRSHWMLAWLKEGEA